ncbi:hypothetical protein FRB90_003233 [Tulasnella sp. 427]|nr:hypothetical protein FRB90_003233 [Tulasnella sp. 427]
MSSSQRSASPPVQAAASELEPSASTPARTASETALSPSQSPSAASSPQEIDPAAKVRNAAAQARHRAKRKAYAAQLEQSVNTLKDTVKNVTNQALLQQLETENRRLMEELQYLQMQLEGSGSSDDGQGMGNAAQWVASSSGSAYLSQYLAPPGIPGIVRSKPDDVDMEEFDETVDSTQFGLKGWSPEQK